MACNNYVNIEHDESQTAALSWMWDDNVPLFDKLNKCWWKYSIYDW